MNLPAARRAPPLYSPRLLGLAANLADNPLTGNYRYSGEGRSRTCGSTIALGIDTDANGRIARIGCRVSACAVGQGSAAILARGAVGRDPDELRAAALAAQAWLAGEGPAPDWPDFDALEPARSRPGRHDALLLGWRAALAALSSGETDR